ncbi:MAG TPA: hypothetical protein VFI42_12985 [Thermomicrobiaceae bacterium]|nr:hypothetical protein [Thermomicrobiaceae bacterium]
MAALDDTQQQPLSLFPPLPARVDRTESDTTTSKPGATNETSTMGPEMLAAQKARENALGQTIDVADNKFAYDKKVAGINADKAAKELAASDATSKAKADAESVYKPDLDRMAAEVRKAHADYQKYESPALFHNRDGWGKAILAASLVIGGFSSAIKKAAMARVGQVDNSDPVGDIIRTDLDRQREAVKHLTDKELSAKSGLKDGKDALAVELAKIDAKGAEMYKRIGQFATMRLQALGMDQAQIDRDGTIAKANEEAAKAQTSAAQGLVNRHTEHEATVTRHTGSGTTINTADPNAKPKGGSAEGDKLDIQQQRIRENGEKLLGEIGKLTPAERATIQDLQKSSAWADKNVTVDMLLSKAGYDKEGAASARVKRVIRMAHEVADAKVTMDTGAVASPEQTRNGMNLILPGPAATKADIRSNEEFLRGVVNNYGRSRKPQPGAAPAAAPTAQPTPATPPPPSTPTAAPGMVRIAPTAEHPKGGTGIIGPDGKRSIRWDD